MATIAGVSDAIRPLTMLGLYKAVLADMDKTQSASFTITRFNYIVNREQMNYVGDVVDVFERTQVITDKIRAVLKIYNYLSTTSPAINATTQVLALPADYLHAVRVAPTWKVTRSFEAFRQDETVRRTASRLTADMQGFAERPNHYLQPTFEDPGWRIIGNNLHLKSGVHSALTLEACEFEYIRIPPTVTLYESDTKDLTVDNSQALIWSADITYLLVPYIVKYLMGNHGDQRLNLYAQLNQPHLGMPPAAPAPASARQQAQNPPQE
jgi:hypothetical protein